MIKLNSHRKDVLSSRKKPHEKQANFETKIAWSGVQHREGCTYFSQEKKAEVRLCQQRVMPCVAVPPLRDTSGL